MVLEVLITTHSMNSPPLMKPEGSSEFTRARQCSISWARWNQSTNFCPISL